MTQQLLSFKDVKNYLGFKSPASLREYIKNGLPVVIVGGSKRIDRTDLEKFIQEHKTQERQK